MELITPGLGLVFWMTVTFSIVLFLLTKFAWKPILSALKEREDSIDSALSAAKKAKEDLENLQADNQRLLDEARVERDKMMKEAQATAQAIIQKAKDTASEEGAKELQAAKSAIQLEKQSALKEIEILAGSLSLQIAEKLLRKNLDNKEAQEALIQQYLKEVN